MIEFLKITRATLEVWANDLALHGVGDITTAKEIDALLANPHAPFAHLTIEDPWRDPAKFVQTATGAHLDALVAKRGCIEPRKEGETDEVFRQRALHTHEVRPRTISFNPLLAAPYGKGLKEFPQGDIYASFATELSKMTPDTFFEQYQCTPARVWRCPFCNKMPEYTHRDGLPVCKCTDLNCKGSERWLEYADFAELNPWIQHNGGPCPVRHEEVQAQLRGHDKSVTYVQGWPERFNWHWGRPGSPTTRTDVLRWRRV